MSYKMFASIFPRPPQQAFVEWNKKGVQLFASGQSLGCHSRSRDQRRIPYLAVPLGMLYRYPYDHVRWKGQ